MSTDSTGKIMEFVASKADIDVADVEPDRTLEGIGLDSLHLMEIALWVQQEYGVDVPEGDLRHDQTVREMLAYLTERTN